MAAVLNCPFEAVRIRTVANPDYARTSVDVLSRIVEEEGVTSLFNAVPIFVVKNVPYAMTKFLVFDLSTEKMYAAFPAAQEELKLSLLVSLIGGILGGTAAAVVSNPAYVQTTSNPSVCVNVFRTPWFSLHINILHLSLSTNRDAVISEMKRAKSDMGPYQSVDYSSGPKWNTRPFQRITASNCLLFLNCKSHLCGLRCCPICFGCRSR